MKIFPLLLACIMLWCGVAFAGKLLDEYAKENDAYKPSDYKASPKIDFHNNVPAKTNPGLLNGSTGAKDNVPLNGNQPDNLNDRSGVNGSGKRGY